MNESDCCAIFSFIGLKNELKFGLDIAHLSQKAQYSLNSMQLIENMHREQALMLKECKTDNSMKTFTNFPTFSS